MFVCQEEGTMRAHNGCARFGGDEWNADWRYSIQPRALILRRGANIRKRAEGRKDYGRKNRTDRTNGTNGMKRFGRYGNYAGRSAMWNLTLLDGVSS